LSYASMCAVSGALYTAIRISERKSVGGDMHKAPLKRRSKWLFQIYWLNKFEIGFYELF